MSARRLVAVGIVLMWILVSADSASAAIRVTVKDGAGSKASKKRTIKLKLR